jgi:putative phage-type endonuclease
MNKDQIKTKLAERGVGMNHLKWLEERRKGIGGSDAAVVLGLSKWKTPYQLFVEKTEGAEDFDSPAMEWGRRLEPVVRQKYADETGNQVFIPKETEILVHPVYDFMLANLDGVTGNERVLEIKTSRTANGWGEPRTDEIPDYYQAQVQHYMAVTGFDCSDVAVLIGGSDFRIYEVPRDDELIEIMIEREAKFWERVKSNNPPEPETLTDLQHKFGKSEAKKVQVTDEVLRAIEQLKEVKSLRKDEDALKAIVMDHLREADTLVDGETVLATWKSGNGARRFDAKAFAKDHPELYENYLSESKPIRRFLLK